jgi:hypothetical protein
MIALFSDEKDGGIIKFAEYVNKIADPITGKLNVSDRGILTFGDGKSIENIWYGTGTGFVGKLTDWKYEREHAEDQLSVLVGGKKFYVISQNNEITDITDEYTKSAIAKEDTEFVKNVKTSLYNWIHQGEDIAGNEIAIGSAILKAIKNGVPFKIYTLSEFKTDQYGDTGLDYADMTEKDDVVSKMAILTSDGLVFPTMSDKKTWVYIQL